MDEIRRYQKESRIDMVDKASELGKRQAEMKKFNEELGMKVKQFGKKRDAPTTNFNNQKPFQNDGMTT